MILLKFFIIFSAFYTIFHWLIRKTDFHGKLFVKFHKNKFAKISILLMFFVFAVTLDIWNRHFQDRLGKFNYISITLAALSAAMFLNFGSLFFRRTKS